MKPARLVLEDGSSFSGEGYGVIDAGSTGEVVFNTSSIGYQEILTDPSYSFQIVVMTYPHIGNYGTRESFEQSDRPHIAGFVVRDLSPDFREISTMQLSDYLAKHGVAAISGVDTRALTRKIRIHGALRGAIAPDDGSPVDPIVDSIRSAPSMAGLDLVKEVTALRPYVVHPPHGETTRRIAVYDFGVKRDIVSRLASAGCDVVVFPASTHADEIINHGFDGVVLSNGPGDPEPVTYAQENIRTLIGRVPILGICLGHQLMGLALGGRTYKLKFGHHGGNHPVKDLRTGRVEVTAQNHGFAVDPDSLDVDAVEPTHINLNDQTLEGFRHRREPILAVQYHPEAAPGPHDSLHVFGELFEMIDRFRGR